MRVLVVGLGRFGGGVGVTRWLCRLGACVTVSDQAEESSLTASIDALAGCDVSMRLGGHHPSHLDGAELVVLNPAVDKARSELFQAIVERRIPWTTELNLFCERCPATVVGMTGTYGKSTTCAMLAHVLEGACRSGQSRFTRAYLGGNIGRSLLDELERMTATDVVVLEMSNAQLEDLPISGFAPQLAVLTNLSPHHMDRYDTYEQYVRAKLNIIGPAARTARVVVGAVDEEAERIMRESIADFDSRVVRVEVPAPAIELTVPGDHNLTNAACALRVCQTLSLDEPLVRTELRTFRGLPHRLSFVKKIDGVDYFNDSKSTSPSATMIGLRAMKRPVVAIVGGQCKDVPADACAAALAKTCKTVICTGESGPILARKVRRLAKGDGRLIVEEARAVSEAVRAARRHACDGDTVLFSPGAPSFDAYANFAERGLDFVAAVNRLSP